MPLTVSDKHFVPVQGQSGLLQGENPVDYYWVFANDLTDKLNMKPKQVTVSQKLSCLICAKVAGATSSDGFLAPK